MRVIICVAICLACAAHGRKVNSDDAHKVAGSRDALASLLSTVNPKAAWQFAGHPPVLTSAHAMRGDHPRSERHPPVVNFFLKDRRQNTKSIEERRKALRNPTKAAGKKSLEERKEEYEKNKGNALYGERKKIDFSTPEYLLGDDDFDPYDFGEERFQDSKRRAQKQLFKQWWLRNRNELQQKLPDDFPILPFGDGPPELVLPSAEEVRNNIDVAILRAPYVGPAYKWIKKTPDDRLGAIAVLVALAIYYIARLFDTGGF